MTVSIHFLEKMWGIDSRIPNVLQSVKNSKLVRTDRSKKKKKTNSKIKEYKKLFLKITENMF